MAADPWSLLVVKGREPGRRLALVGPETILGNALDGAAGIDLAGQEGSSPRRMAARQASILADGRALTLRDLESPGGTFVNGRRVLAGQARPLQADDLIQVGSVQLRVVASGPTVAATTGFVFTLACGATCRSWDDFPPVAAQRWADLRDELTSGRLAAWLGSIRRADLAPARSLADAVADERLDAWLASLPTTRPPRPELDVHPARLVVRASPGGGTIGGTVRVGNVGERLLHARAGFDPPAPPWAGIVGRFAGGATVAVVDADDLAIQFAIPPTLASPLRATLRVEGDGGVARVDVVLQARPAAGDPPEPGPGPVAVDLIGPVALPTRLALAAIFGGLARLAVGLTGGLLPVAAALAVGAGLLGVGLGRRGGIARIVFGGVSAGIAGAGLAALAVAARRAVEPAGLPTFVAAVAWAVAAMIIVVVASVDRKVKEASR